MPCLSAPAIPVRIIDGIIGTTERLTHQPTTTHHKKRRGANGIFDTIFSIGHFHHLLLDHRPLTAFLPPSHSPHHKTTTVATMLLLSLLLLLPSLAQAFVLPTHRNHPSIISIQRPSSSSASTTTRLSVLQDYNNNHNNNLDDIDMDRWINSLMDQLQDFSRHQLQSELRLVDDTYDDYSNHHSTSSRQRDLTREELVYRILKARLQMAAAAEQRLEDNFHNSNDIDHHWPHHEHSHHHHEEEEPVLYSSASSSSSSSRKDDDSLEEPEIGSVQVDDDDVRDIMNAVDDANRRDNNSRSPPSTPTSTEHWSTAYYTNKKGSNSRAAVSLNDYDDSRRERHAYFQQQQNRGSQQQQQTFNNRFGAPGGHTTNNANYNNNNNNADHSASGNTNAGSGRQLYNKSNNNNNNNVDNSKSNQRGTNNNAGAGWHEPQKRKSSSFFASTNHFVIGEEDEENMIMENDDGMMGESPPVSFGNTGKSTFPDRSFDLLDSPPTTTSPSSSTDNYDNNTNKGPQRSRYTPGSHPHLTSHQSSTSSVHGRRSLFVDHVDSSTTSSPQRSRRRAPVILELPMTMQNGVPTVQLGWQTTTKSPSSTTTKLTTFVIDTGRYRSAVPAGGNHHQNDLVVRRPLTNPNDRTQQLGPRGAAATPRQLQSANENDDIDDDEEEMPVDATSFLMMLPSGDDDATKKRHDNDIRSTPFVLSSATDDASNVASPPNDGDSNSNPWLLPEPPVEAAAAATPQGVPLAGFITDRGVFFAASVDNDDDIFMADALDADEQMLQQPHGCLGMDILSSFDFVEFDFDREIMRLVAGRTATNDHDEFSILAESALTALPLLTGEDMDEELYTLPLRVDGRGPANLLISTSLPTTIMTWKGVNDGLGLSVHSHEISDIEGTFSLYSTVASHLTHYLTVSRKLELGNGRRTIASLMNQHDFDPSAPAILPSLPGLTGGVVGMTIPVGQFPTNIGHNEHLNRAFERKRTGGIIGMDVLSKCSVLRLSSDHRHGGLSQVQMLGRGRRPPQGPSSQLQRGGGGFLRP
jgi:hypothetical protein